MKTSYINLPLMLMLLISAPGHAQQIRSAGSQSPLDTGGFHWQASPPLLSAVPGNLPPSPDNPWHAVKDPTVVRHEGRWHLFCTLRKQRGGNGKPPGYIRIGHLSFEDWKDAPQARWSLLEMSPGYHAAPQVFYFTPHRKWYLVYQLEDAERGIPFGPCFSTTDDLGDPTSWTRPEPMYAAKPANVKGWLDFWVICDEQHAHLFFTSLNGQLWRAQTRVEDFPRGFGEPVVALRGDFFEASHTYRLRGMDKFLTIVEAQGRSGGRGRRYYKAYVANDLAGTWSPLAATPEQPFAGGANVHFAEERWTDSISHGELIRANNDEHLEVDPKRLQMLFQGLADKDWGNQYGRLGWRLGLLTTKSTHFDPVVRELEGWTVHIDPQLLEGEHAAMGRQALKMLAGHLQRIAVLMPEDRLAEMRKLEIWIERQHPEIKTAPGPYHPDVNWLTERGYDPRLAKKVHITQAASLLERHHMLKHPAVILHELAHAYHDQVLGFDEPRIKAAYQKAMEAGLYEEVLSYSGKKVRHYAATNHKEYFAEGTEAYFYRNDFYPFVRAELEEHDPDLHNLLKEIWGPLD